MATYYITAIDKQTVGNHTFIAKVLLHLVDNSGVHTGQVRTKDYVINLIKSNNNIFTATWNYSNPGWRKQEPVSYETRNNQEYLRSTPDASKRDNLLHLLPLENLGLH